jgi:predicted 2-oxoglutarate/Fe(II)-dependent dioxygenase YbiX
VNIESSLGDKGLYITDCINQEAVSNILELEKKLNRPKINQIHFFRSNIPTLENEFGKYLKSSIDAAILAYINGSNKIPSEYIIRTEYQMSDWKLRKRLAPHIDSIKYAHADTQSPRSIINALLYLTDQYEGGEIVFPEINIAIKPKAGSVVVFDSDLQHGVNAVTSGVRKTLSANLYSIYAEDIEEVKILGYRYLG